MKERINTETGEILEEGMPEHDFSVLVATAEDGDLDADASDLLRELTEKVMAIGKPGKLVMTMKVDKVNEGLEAVSVQVDMKMTPPKLPRTQSVRFVDDNRSLSENPPNQRIIFNRDLTVADDMNQEK